MNMGTERLQAFIRIYEAEFGERLTESQAKLLSVRLMDFYERLARPLSSFLARTWNVEGTAPGSQFEKIYLGGGGAYYFQDVVCRTFPDTRIVTVPDSQLANLCGYLTLAASLPEACWKEATRLYETSIAYARRLHDQ